MSEGAEQLACPEDAFSNRRLNTRWSAITTGKRAASCHPVTTCASFCYACGFVRLRSARAEPSAAQEDGHDDNRQGEPIGNERGQRSTAQVVHQEPYGKPATDE